MPSSVCVDAPIFTQAKCFVTQPCFYMYDMTLSPREAIAKFQDLFNEHYYRCDFTPRWNECASGPQLSQTCFSPSTSRLSSLLGIKQPFFCTLDLLQVSECDVPHNMNMSYPASFRQWTSSTTAALLASGFTCPLLTLNYARS